MSYFTTEQELNIIGRNCLLDDNLGDGLVIQRLETSGDDVTFTPDDPNESFTLRSPVSGGVKLFSGRPTKNVAEDKIGILAVKRILVGYSACKKIKTEADLLKFLMPTINEAKLDLNKHLGMTSTENYKIRVHQDGGRIFREMENFAAFEFRLVAVRDQA